MRLHILKAAATRVIFVCDGAATFLKLSRRQRAPKIASVATL